MSVSVTVRSSLIYFDRNIIKKKWQVMNKDPMEKASNIVMVIARRSIRNQAKRHLGVKRRTPSKPGRAPYSWQPGKLPPFKMIFAEWLHYNPLQVSRIVGMVGLGSDPPIPGLHEHGGTALRNVQIIQARRTKSGRMTSPKVTRRNMVVKYPARPFMRPALNKARAYYSELWRGSLTR